MNIGIIGLGLIGGSFAKSLKKNTNHMVFGFDIDGQSVDLALKDKSIDFKLDTDDLLNIDLVILALRPKDALRFVKENKNIRGWVMDLCGVKKKISKELEYLSSRNNFEYIGAHPMAGREIGGYTSSLDDLFEGASIILTKRNVPNEILNILSEMGFSLQYCDADTHDRMIAYTSQLSHIVSNAFVKSKVALKHNGFSADSLKDLTRVAMLDESMWTELLLENDYIKDELDFLIDELKKYSDLLEKRDEKGLELLLREGKERRVLMYPRGVK